MLKNLRSISLFIVIVLLAGCSSMIHRTSGNNLEEDPGSRTMGEVIDDNSIEVKVKVAILNLDPELENYRVRVVSHNGKVLIVGQLPNQELVDEITAVASEVRKVKSVHNEISIGNKLSVGVRANDSWLGVRVRSKMFAADDFPSKKVTVITENGVVYLMGIVPEKIGEEAVELASTVGGVQKVVKLFEYII